MTDRPALDVNKYATKKTIAQGMLDIALLTANASQLKYVLTVGDSHQFYTLLVILISVSIGLQCLNGLIYVTLGVINIGDFRRQKHARAQKLNLLSVTIAFLVQVVQVVMEPFKVQPGALGAADVAKGQPPGAFPVWPNATSAGETKQ